MDGYSMPTKSATGDSLNHAIALDNAIKCALNVLRDYETSNKDVADHLANAERELRAASRALKL